MLFGAVTGCSSSASRTVARDTGEPKAASASIISHPATAAACDVFTAAAVGGVLHASVLRTRMGPSWTCFYTTRGSFKTHVDVAGSLQEGSPTTLSRVLTDEISRGALAIPGVGDEAVWTQGDLVARSGRWLVTVQVIRGINQPDRATAIAVARSSIPLLPR
jgi:hypothetical protein